jgi:hypothetical protein
MVCVLSHRAHQQAQYHCLAACRYLQQQHLAMAHCRICQCENLQCQRFGLLVGLELEDFCIMPCWPDCWLLLSWQTMPASCLRSAKLLGWQQQHKGVLHRFLHRKGTRGAIDWL